MGCDVFANSNEIACKAGGNKVVADFPDVCMSPPSPPAGPIPVPYPDTSFSKDMKNGSKTVKIKNKEVMLKDKSFYKSSPLGDEAATRSFGANVLSHVITGKTYFIAWSMDVKFEGKNVDRHIDLMTSNHNPTPGAPPGPSLATMSAKDKAAAGHQMENDPPCATDKHKWDCDTYSCAGCWNAECQANADHTNKEYNELQAGTQQEKVDKQKDYLDDKIARKHGDPDGNLFEKDAIDKNVANSENIENLGYFAHCNVCHFKQDIDIITDKAMKECKKNAKSHDLKQMTRYKTINDQCFDGDKDLVCVTTEHELKKPKTGLNSKLSKTDWAPLGAMGEDP